MAVYTSVPAETLTAFLRGYDVGRLIAVKGIAEGVENSNYLIDTDAGRYFLTLYEKRVDAGDLPYFLALMEHLAAAGMPVPRPVADRGGKALQQLCGRPACLIEFLPGFSVTQPSGALCRAAGSALGNMHAAAADFGMTRKNALGHEGRAALAASCIDRLGEIDRDLPTLVRDELAYQQDAWPAGLPQGTIHADLFPDNVLVLDEQITGLIDFYFACTDVRAYDLAVMHGAWCFSADGHSFDAGLGEALEAGYRAAYRLSDAELAAMPVLRRAAALRFLLTRAYDLLHTPAGALVRPHDPLAYARRLLSYREAK